MVSLWGTGQKAKEKIRKKLEKKLEKNTILTDKGKTSSSFFCPKSKIHGIWFPIFFEKITKVTKVFFGIAVVWT